METPPVITPPVMEPAPSPEEAAKRGGGLRWLWRAACFPVKFLFGLVFCQGLLMSLLVLGWAYRLAQRTAIKHWWKRSDHRSGGGTFEEFLGSDESIAGHRDWPNWFVEQRFISLFRTPEDGNWGGRIWDIFRGFTAGLRRNLVIGIQGAFNLALLTLPAGLLWWFGWDYGWNISFYKGYEQALIGTGVFAVGGLLFIGTMFYLPLAQARQAVTGDWRSFWNIDLVIRILRSQWIWVLLLSGLLALLCVPVLILKTAPQFLSESANIETIEQAIEYVTGYAYSAAAFVLPAFVLLRVLAAKIYAHGILRAVQERHVDLAELAPTEREILQRLNLHEGKPPVLEHWYWKIARWMGSRVGQFFAASVLFWVWVAVIVAVVLSEFLAYHETGRGWWNQQLIQLPWFDYMPTHIAANPEHGQPTIAAQVGRTLFLATGWMTLRYGYQFVTDLIAKRKLPE